MSKETKKRIEETEEEEVEEVETEEVESSAKGKKFGKRSTTINQRFVECKNLEEFDSCQPEQGKPCRLYIKNFGLIKAYFEKRLSRNGRVVEMFAISSGFRRNGRVFGGRISVFERQIYSLFEDLIDIIAWSCEYLDEEIVKRIYDKMKSALDDIKQYLPK